MAAKKKTSNPKPARGSKSAKKLPGRFSRLFRSKRMVVLVLFIFVFASAGSYTLYSRSSAAYSKSIITCRNAGVVLRRGSTGECVRVLQNVLNNVRDIHNTGWPALTVDGQFGPRTETSVIYFQYANRLKVDGVVGDQTWGELFNDCRYLEINFGANIGGC